MECTQRTLDVHWTYTERIKEPPSDREPCMSTKEARRRRSRRLELRTTPEEREMIERAAAASDTGLTEFVVSSAVNAAQRVLADRDRFELDPVASEAWEALNARPARDLPGLRRLMERPSPFTA
jgi:uncharacterized protein (DUF1778 family)